MSALAPAPTHSPDAHVLDWIHDVTGASNLKASFPDAPGRARNVWLIDGRHSDGSVFSCVIRHDSGKGPWTGTSFTLGREGAVLRAIEGTGVPAPGVIAISEDGNILAIERLAGTAALDFADDRQRLSTIDSLLEALVALHELPVDTLDLPFGIPRTPQDHALMDMAEYRHSYDRCRKYPEMDAAFAWLESHAPDRVTRTSLVQGDAGPGNFLHQDGRITGLVDWEAAHVGDPMDDLAWFWFRKCFLRRDTDLGHWLRRYADIAGRPIDPELIAYYRVLVAVRATTGALTRQEYEPGYDKPKVDMMIGMVQSALADPIGPIRDSIAG
jgi:aminoglycoside phosphotransferase (APT) family kinase protein